MSATSPQSSWFMPSTGGRRARLVLGMVIGLSGCTAITDSCSDLSSHPLLGHPSITPFTLFTLSIWVAIPVHVLQVARARVDDIPARLKVCLHLFAVSPLACLLVARHASGVVATVAGACQGLTFFLWGFYVIGGFWFVFLQGKSLAIGVILLGGFALWIVGTIFNGVASIFG